MSEQKTTFIEGDSISESAPGYWSIALNLTLPNFGTLSSSATGLSSWPFRSNGMNGVNCALGGSSLMASGSIKDRFATRVQPLIQKSKGNPPLSVYANKRPDRKYVLSIFEGANESSTSNPTTACNNLISYLQTAVTAGIDGIVACTCLSNRNSPEGNEAAFETYRQGRATIMRTWNNATFGVPFALADFAGTSPIGDPGACDNTDLFVDGTHPTPLGHAYMALAWSISLNTVLAAL